MSNIPALLTRTFKYFDGFIVLWQEAMESPLRLIELLTRVGKKQVPRLSLYNGRMDVRTNTGICDGRVEPENKGKDPYYNETIKSGMNYYRKICTRYK